MASLFYKACYKETIFGILEFTEAYSLPILPDITINQGRLYAH